MDELMRLFLVRRTDSVDYNEYGAMLVRAKNVAAAKAMVFERSGRNGGMRDDNVEVLIVTSKGQPGIIIRDFRAG